MQSDSTYLDAVPCCEPCERDLEVLGPMGRGTAQGPGRLFARHLESIGSTTPVLTYKSLKTSHRIISIVILHAKVPPDLHIERYHVHASRRAPPGRGVGERVAREESRSCGYRQKSYVDGHRSGHPGGCCGRW